MKRVLSLLLVTSSIFPMQLALVNNDIKTHIKQESFFAPSDLGSVELYHGKKGFHVKQDTEKYKIKKYFTDPLVRDITKKQLNAFLECGYLSLNKMEDGQYSLKAKGRLQGGGPLLGTIAYWVTKTACYTVGFAAVSGAVITTGGTAVGLATGSAAALGGGVLTTAAVATTSAAAIGTTAGVVVGTAGVGAAIGGTAAVVGGAVGATAVAGKAAVVTAAAVTSAGGVAGAIAGVESVSLAVGTFFGMLPTP